MRIELCRELRPFSALCAALGALPVGCLATEVRGVATDSREVERGDVFVALQGARCDGAAYAEEALSRGAAAVLAPFAAALPRGCPALRVERVEEALLRAAACHRTRQMGEVIAVSGSTGKTTVKEAIATVLTQRGEVAYSQGNFNSSVGMPLSVLSFAPCAFWVLELGVSHPGEMAPMARAAHPTLAVLTNVGSAHIGNYRSAQELLQEKLTLTAHLHEGGRALLPRDLPAAALPCPSVAAYRFGAGGDFYLTDISEGEKSLRGDLIAPDRVITNLGWSNGGRSGVAVVETVGGVGALLGVSDAELRRGLRAAAEKTPRMRHVTVGDRLLIDDSYNASPEAMTEALRLLSLKAGERPIVAVLGDMLELGVHSERLHAQIGRAAAQAGLDLLITYGAWSGAVACAAMAAGMAPERVVSFGAEQRALLVEALIRMLPRGAVVLCKASGKMKLSEIVREVAERL